jgi:uncharacterized protein (TIGR03083 family)
MSTPTTLAALVDRITIAHQRFLQVVGSLSDAQLQEPRLPGGWSVKDVLAHLAWWDRWLLYNLNTDNGQAAHLAPPLMDQIPPDEHWADQMNARVYQLNRSRSLAEIQAEFEAARQRVVQSVVALQPEDIFSPMGRLTSSGRLVGPLVFGIYEHYEEHAHEIETQYW